MIRAYHRPTTIEAALGLLARTDVTTALLGGGTELLGLPPVQPGEVIDLQALGLDEITAAGDRLQVGATATLQQLADDDRTSGLIRELARREAPNTIRNAATVGGTVATASWESGLLAGLLVSEALVTVVEESGAHQLPLADALADRPAGIITSVSFEPRIGLFEATARTPADTPIVLVAAARDDSGAVSVAATGVAPVPIVVDPGAMADVQPPADFRGSSDYRKHLLQVLHARAIGRLEEVGS